MITDWRGERRIGPPSLTETLAPHILWTVGIAAISAAIGIVSVLILGAVLGLRSPAVLTNLWCLFYGAGCISTSVRWAMSRAWIAAVLMVAVMLIGVLTAKAFAHRALFELGVLPELIVPVTQ